LDTDRVNDGEANQKAAKHCDEWQKTPSANLIRYVSFGTYYARLQV